ncbi:MAG: thioredoxin family protein [Synergistaceae bacterium]|jgi:glutaredoxin|nr:thioredoxin family protein [Synergistaceae bacterium]
MKEIKMFMMATCPHCRKALEMMDDIYSKNPGYKDIPLKKIDETKEPDYASKFDYYYVPTFYVGDDKMHEGVPTREAIEKVFEAAAS